MRSTRLCWLWLLHCETVCPFRLSPVFWFWNEDSRCLATLPKAVYNPDTNRTLCYRTPRSPLQLSSNVPISMSFGIFDSSVIYTLLMCHSLLIPVQEIDFFRPYGVWRAPTWYDNHDYCWRWESNCVAFADWVGLANRRWWSERCVIWMYFHCQKAEGRVDKDITSIKYIYTSQ